VGLLEQRGLPADRLGGVTGSVRVTDVPEQSVDLPVDVGRIDTRAGAGKVFTWTWNRRAHRTPR